MPRVKLSRNRPVERTGSNLTTVARFIDKSWQSLADSSKSSVARSSTFFISQLASWITHFLKYIGKIDVRGGKEEGVDVVEVTVAVLLSAVDYLA